MTTIIATAVDMKSTPLPPIQIFDPDQDYRVTNRRLPHWSQAGTLTFITWRTWDSIPEKVLANWLSDRDQWLKRHGIDPRSADWRTQLASLDGTSLPQFQKVIADRWNEHLDACHGSCVLRNRE